MAEPNHEQLRRIFDLAIAAAAEDRAELLERECRGDAELKNRITAMIAAAEDEQFLAEPTSDMCPTEDLDSGASTRLGAGPDPMFREGPGARIGPYKLLQLIGEGGFGSVFMAEQERPVSRKVALKIIKLGMDTRQVVARFEQERQALAMMDHPNIAKVFDAGATETGRPFFVMELCRGDPIAEFADRHSMSIRDRLELFAQVCHAVQHAHTKGIIHRDIKPSNVLVSAQDGRPHAKVIDFGIAKATASKLTEKTLFTEHRQLIGTPEYMSPEQAEGSLDIDTRTDVYSLGVLLYELLTGSTPFSSRELRSAAYADIQRIIREVDPPKPSTRLSANSDTLPSVAAQRRTEPRRLGTIVRGELDWIVMKALEKDRSRRYETPGGLAADIARYLSGEAVVAAPPSAAYRFRKFARRNRVSVATGAAVAAALVLGVVGTSLGMVWAFNEKSRADAEAARALLAADAETDARKEAQRRLEQTEKATNILASVFESLDPREIATSGRPLQQVLADNLDRAVRELEGDAVGDSRALLRVQEKLGYSLLALGETDRAITVLERAERTSAQTFGPEDATTLAYRSALANAYGNAGKYDVAIPMLERLIAHYKTLDDPGDILATNQNNLGLRYRELGKLEQALPLFEQVVASRRKNLGPLHPHTLATINALATTYDQLNRGDEAMPLYLEAVEGFKATVGVEHPSTLAAMNNLGAAYAGRGEYARAITLMEEVVRTSKLKLGHDSPSTLAAMASLGIAYQKAGMEDKSLSIFEESLALMRNVLGNEHVNTLATMTNVGRAYWGLGQLEKSVPLYEEAFATYTRKFGPDNAATRQTAGNLGINYHDAGRFQEALPLLRQMHGDTRNNPSYNYISAALADTCARLGLKEEAVSVANSAVALLRKDQPENSPALAGGLVRYGQSLLTAGDAAAAEPLLREALAIREKEEPDEWTTFNTRAMLGAAIAGQSRFDEAEPLLISGYEGLNQRAAQIPPAVANRTPEAIERLVRLYEAKGDQAKAAEWKTRLAGARNAMPAAKP